MIIFWDSHGQEPKVSIWFDHQGKERRDEDFSNKG